MKIALVTTCKGFRRHLEKSLPGMLSQDCPDGHAFSVLVVDYGCPDGTFDWLQTIGDRRLRGVRVMGTGPHFNLSRAVNIGAKHARSDVLFFCDCDDVPPMCALREGLALMQAGARLVNWERRFGDEMVCFGASMVHTEVWHSVRGFDENLGGRHGLTDSDFYTRVRNGFKFSTIPSDGWIHLQQEHGEGTRFYESRDYDESFQENARRIWERGGLVNPLGIGIAEVETFGVAP